MKRAFRERLETTAKEFYHISSEGAEDESIGLTYWLSSMGGNHRTTPSNKVLKL